MAQVDGFTAQHRMPVIREPYRLDTFAVDQSAAFHVRIQENQVGAVSLPIDRGEQVAV
ncbi:hypothetical protein D3C75_1186070 [compost metagenome]